MAATERQRKHLTEALISRRRYQGLCHDAKKAAEDAGITSLPTPLKPLTPTQQPPQSMHYSWDYAQNVSLPSSYDQVGPSYFTTLRKCHLFGICCEAFPQQVIQ